MSKITPVVRKGRLIVRAGSGVRWLAALGVLGLALASCVDQGERRSSAQPSAPVAVAALPPEWRDYGDAPEGTATLYREGAQEGQFPSRAASGAPAHELSGKVWLGLLVSPEAAPRGRDGDDGLLHLEVHRCAKSSALVLVNVSGLSRTDRGSPVYVNLFFDWNRDGRWQGGDACAQEW
ncbi:MAG: hypothetical protein HYY05_02650, partial [Chloroflexi bacterium]|nr:hypothetical protein [Chloroflexota bacterium]